MATNEHEGFGERVAEFFTQKPEDRQYEESGGDAAIPAELRTDDPVADVQRWTVLKERAAAGVPVLSVAAAAAEAFAPEEG